MHGDHETVGGREMAGTFEAVALRPSQAEGQMRGVRRATTKAPQLRHSACRLQKRDTAGKSWEQLETGGSLPEGDGNDSPEIKQLRGQI